MLSYYKTLDDIPKAFRQHQPSKAENKNFSDLFVLVIFFLLLEIKK